MVTVVVTACSPIECRLVVPWPSSVLLVRVPMRVLLPEPERPYLHEGVRQALGGALP